MSCCSGSYEESSAGRVLPHGHSTEKSVKFYPRTYEIKTKYV